MKDISIITERPEEVDKQIFDRYRKAVNVATKKYLRGRLIYEGRHPVYVNDKGEEDKEDSKKLFFRKGVPYKRTEPKVLGNNKFKK